MAASLGQALPVGEALLADLLEHGLQLQHAGLPAAVVFDQRADVREADAEAVQQPEQGPFHHRALVEKAMIEAHPDEALHEAERHVRDDAPLVAASLRVLARGEPAVALSPAEVFGNTEAGNLYPQHPRNALGGVARGDREGVRLGKSV